MSMQLHISTAHSVLPLLILIEKGMHGFNFSKTVGSGGSEGAIASQIFLDMRKIVAFSTPNIFRLQE